MPPRSTRAERAHTCDYARNNSERSLCRTQSVHPLASSCIDAAARATRTKPTSRFPHTRRWACAAHCASGA